MLGTEQIVFPRAKHTKWLLNTQSVSSENTQMHNMHVVTMKKEAKN